MSKPNKLKLEIDELRVESFEIASEGESRGTVHGHIRQSEYNYCEPLYPQPIDYTENPDACATADYTCAASCNGSCATCYNTCNGSCPGTCYYSCQATCDPCYPEPYLP